MKIPTKVIFLYPLLLSFFSIICLSCQKTPINGDLDGEWEVIEVTPEPPEWSDGTRIFYNFSHHVCQLTLYGGPFTVGNLLYEDNSITLNFPFIESPWEESLLKQYGIYSNPITFNTKFEGKQRLTLSNDEVTVVLKKF